MIENTRMENELAICNPWHLQWKSGYMHYPIKRTWKECVCCNNVFANLHYWKKHSKYSTRFPKGTFLVFKLETYHRNSNNLMHSLHRRSKSCSLVSFTDSCDVKHMSGIKHKETPIVPKPKDNNRNRKLSTDSKVVVDPDFCHVDRQVPPWPFRLFYFITSFMLLSRREIYARLCLIFLFLILVFSVWIAYSYFGMDKIWNYVQYLIKIRSWTLWLENSCDLE